MKSIKAYRVKVEASDALGSSFEIDGEYYNCEDSEIYILTDNPADIFYKLGKIAKSVEEIGIGLKLEKDIFDIKSEDREEQ